MMIIHLEDKTSNLDRGCLQSFIWARSDDRYVERSSQAKKGIRKSHEKLSFCGVNRSIHTYLMVSTRAASWSADPSLQTCSCLNFSRLISAPSDPCNTAFRSSLVLSATPSRANASMETFPEHSPSTDLLDSTLDGSLSVEEAFRKHLWA